MRRGVETIAAGRNDRPYGTFTSYVAFDRDDEEQLAKAVAQTEPDVLREQEARLSRQIRRLESVLEREGMLTDSSIF